MRADLKKRLSLSKCMGRFFAIILGYILAFIGAVSFMVFGVLMHHAQSTGNMIESFYVGFLALLVPFFSHGTLFYPIAGLLLLFEVLKIRSFTFYVMAGIGIAFLPFFIEAFYISEVDILMKDQNKSLIALFGASGALGGVIYWLIAGRRAGNVFILER